MAPIIFHPAVSGRRCAIEKSEAFRMSELAVCCLTAEPHLYHCLAQAPMHISVLECSKSVLEVDLSGVEPVQSIMALLQDRLGYPMSQQLLTCSSRPLTPFTTLAMLRSQCQDSALILRVKLAGRAGMFNGAKNVTPSPYIIQFKHTYTHIPHHSL